MHEERHLSTDTNNRPKEKQQHSEILEQNLSRTELLLDVLEKTIIVGGFRYYALLAHQAILSGLSLAAILILAYYIALRLAEAVCIPVGCYLKKVLSLREKHELTIAMTLAFVSLIAWYAVFYDVVNSLRNLCVTL
ncbi:hypothetical protein [Acidocella sp.]|uniref:hypothetical protein n=1 Tax=Acidocella sp. TaxID=50710 RepID=UPI002629D285|nr:hypothetical protein [Acidocella sp.]